MPCCLRYSSSCTSYGPVDLRRVSVLLEARDLSTAQEPDVDELRVNGNIGGLEGSAVAASDDDGVAGVEELGGHDLKGVPLGGEAGEDAFGDGGGADVRVAIGVGEALGFVPHDGGIHE